MTFAGLTDAHQARCETGLARLRMLACGEACGAFPGQVATDVREATNAVIAEAEAAGRAALAAAAGARGELEAQTFLLVRLARLAEAADQAVSAAYTADANGLRRYLRRFDALASAMWAAQPACIRPGTPSRLVSRHWIEDSRAGQALGGPARH